MHQRSKNSFRLCALVLVSAITTPLVLAQDPLSINLQAPSPRVVGQAYTRGASVEKDREQDQRLTITSVVNGASFEPGFAAGSWVTIFGEDLAPTTRIWRDDEIVGGVLPTSLDGVQALINGKPAAIFFISPGQLNVQAPDDTTLGPVSVEVVQESGASVTSFANLQKASPAFFLFNPEGRRFLAAVHPDGVFVGKPDLFGGARPTRPVEPGNIILIFGTGFGLTDPPVPSGQVLSSGAVPLANTVSVRFGEVDADVLFAGLSGTGLNQFNVVVPEGLPTRDVEVVAEILGFSTQSDVFVTVESPGTPPPPAPRPSVTLTAEPEFILRGEFATLRWISQNATSAELSPGIGPVATSGSLAVFPSSTTTYTITVKGVGGEASTSVRVTVREPVPPPSALTNLQATAVSQVRINLSWTNTATNARSVRIELRVGSFGAFREFASLGPRTNAVDVIQLSALTTYTFRVRAEGEGGFSPYSNEASATTLAKLTIFLVHPDPSNVRTLATEGLLDPLFGIDQQRFDVDWGFDYSQCTPTTFFCSADCNISVGAVILADYINKRKPQGDIVVVGYSMGGLVARDMLLNNYLGVVTQRRAAALITIATPNGGYPFSHPDPLVGCGPVLRQMDGNWRSRQSENLVVLSNYLSGLNEKWGNSSFIGNPQRWFAVSGTSCNNPRRVINSTTGCPDRDVFSDGVVCDVSAQLRINFPVNNPTLSWSSPNYAHTGGGFLGEIVQSLILCGPGFALPFDNPPAGSVLVETLVRFLNELL